MYLNKKNVTHIGVHSKIPSVELTPIVFVLYMFSYHSKKVTLGTFAV